MTNESKILVGLIGIPTVLILILGTMYATKNQAPELTEDANAKLEVLGEATHDWGEIDINGGNASKDFQIKNTGTSDLFVTNFETSCMCTETQVMINGEKSPVFGMHSQSGWTGTIKPGETADILVVFDPLFHGPEGTGPITRLVSFNSNDSDNKTVEFKLSGNVISKEN